MYDTMPEDVRKAFDVAIHTLKKSHQGKWIPTSEFSPEEYDSYLVMWRFRSGEYDGKLFYEICEYDPDEDGWERIEQAGEAGAEIVAWMPLPERYEPKQDDDTAKDMI
jgi:hypothetical protein